MKSEQENQIFTFIGEIRQATKDIKEELRKINGTIKDHDTKIDTHDTDIDKMKGSITTVKYIWTAIAAIIGIAIAWFKK